MIDTIADEITSECLDDQQLLELVEGLGGDRTLARHRAHLAICSACRALFADVEGCLTRSRDVAPTSKPVPASAASSASAASAAAASAASASAVSSRYEFLRDVGEGGTSSVVAMRDKVLDRDVAVKTLHPWLVSDANAIVRFVQEAHLMARLEGRAAPRVIDVGTNEMGLPFIVMELVDGETLSARVRRKGKLPIDEAVTLVALVCDALAISHAKGVIHRDVKPGNVMVARTRTGLAVKLVDFGLAKADGAARRTSEAGDVFGTPGYMAPEQMRDAHDADARSDIWAAGVLLYRCLTGENPFAAVFDPESVEAYVPARVRRPDVPPVLDEIIARCLQPTPRLRYANASELAASLRKVSSVVSTVVVKRRRPKKRKSSRRASALTLVLAVMTALVLAALLVIFLG